MMRSTRAIRPMLACSRNVTIEDLQSLQMPMYVSVKQDGIRCRLDRDKKGRIWPMSRALKPLPNCHIQDWADRYGIEGLDGEIVIPGKSFNDIQSWVMTNYTMPAPFEFRVFDILVPNASFQLRLLNLQELLISSKVNSRIKLIDQQVAKTIHDIECEFEYHTDHGEEGLILRSPSGLYKSGRSTWNQAYSLKMKQFEDDEGAIVGYYALNKNENPSVLNELGLKKKSTHQDNQVLQNLLGGFIIRTEQFGLLRVGSGFTLAQRQRWWKRRTSLDGQEITYKFQRHGMKDKPRSPIFKSLNSILQ